MEFIEHLLTLKDSLKLNLLSNLNDIKIKNLCLQNDYNLILKKLKDLFKTNQIKLKSFYIEKTIIEFQPYINDQNNSNEQINKGFDIK